MTDSEYENALRQFLRPSEEVKLVLDANMPMLLDHDAQNSYPSPASDHHLSNPTALPGPGHPEFGVNIKRILAIVIHRDKMDDCEEGSIFIFKPISNFAHDDLDVYSVFPITGNFSIAITQTRQRTTDHRTPLTSVVPGSGFLLTINTTQGEKSETLTLLTHDVERLRSVIGECKRLKAIYVAANTPSKTHSWLAPYAPQSWPFVISSSSPLDLRIVHQPLQAHLSPAAAGLPGDDLSDMQIIRDDWVRNAAREACIKNSTFPSRSIRIHLGTFNVNGKLPSQDLSPWVRGYSLFQVPKVQVRTQCEKERETEAPRIVSPSAWPFRNILQYVVPQASASPGTSTKMTTQPTPAKDEDHESDPDIFVFAFQELDLSAEALLYSTSTEKEDAWCLALFAGLGEKAVFYEKLASKQLVGMLLVIFVRKSLRPCFHDIKSCSAGVGIMGMMGNKGATALRLTFTPPPTTEIQTPCSTTFTFVNSHLAAFDEMVEKRNTDFQELSKRLRFHSEGYLDDLEKPPTSIIPSINVYETDALFWMGDLNYRIDIPDADVRNILSSEWDGKIKTLLKYDQLNDVIRTQRAFNIFSEFSITHLPTYRFSAGLLTDELGYDIKRKPAWTDRILYAGGPSPIIQQYSYSGHSEITMSDHRPVSANFTVIIDAFDKTLYNTTFREFYQLVTDLRHSQERPNIRINPPAVDFGKIFYKRSVFKIVVVQNLGKTPCTYRFVPAEPGISIHPEWLHIEPMAGLILPEETISITLTACVDKDSASRFNIHSKQLSCTLILHLARGKDHFIAVAGDYEFTCFANKLSDLTRLPGPIRSVKTVEDLLPHGRAINAPREIMRVVNWLMTNATEAVGLFTSPVEEELVDIIRECLDTGADFPSTPYDSRMILAMGDTLLQLLDSLTDPVVPPSLHSQCMEATSRDEAFQVLDVFPSVSVNVWISVTAFLHFISLQGPELNANSKAQNLASTFAPVLLRDDPTQSYTPISPLGKHSFLLFFVA